MEVNPIFYDGQPTIAYADSSQWDKRYDNGRSEIIGYVLLQIFNKDIAMLGFADGKWYFLNTEGRMETDVLIGDKSKRNDPFR